jgi:hypothetical protein
MNMKWGKRGCVIWVSRIRKEGWRESIVAALHARVSRIKSILRILSILAPVTHDRGLCSFQGLLLGSVNTWVTINDIYKRNRCTCLIDNCLNYSTTIQLWTVLFEYERTTDLIFIWSIEINISEVFETQKYITINCNHRVQDMNLYQKGILFVLHYILVMIDLLMSCLLLLRIWYTIGTCTHMLSIFFS